MKFLLLLIDLIMYAICIRTLILFPYLCQIQIFLTFHFFCWCGYLFKSFVICRPRGIVNFRTVVGKLAISTIFLVDLEAHFVRNIYIYIYIYIYICSLVLGLVSSPELYVCNAYLFFSCFTVQKLHWFINMIRPEFFSQRFP